MLTFDKSKLAEARALVDQAAAEQRQQQLNQLAQVREALRTGRARYTELRSQFYSEKQNRGNAQQKIDQQLERIADSFDERPRVADLLPDDPDVKRWRQAHEALLVKRDQLIAQRDALPDPERLRAEAGAYEGQYGTIGTLEFTEANLMRALEGGSGIVRTVGGISGVR
jgi:hypothetical protein